MPSGCTVTVVKDFHGVAATDGLLVVGHSDIDIVGGLIGEIVDTGEPCLTEIMRLAFEAHAKVVDIISPPFHAAPILAEGRAAVTHIKDGILARFYGFIKRDRQNATFLTETLHIVEIASHVGSDKAHQFQHNGICVASSGKVNERLPLQCVISEIEIPNMDFIMRHVNVFAHGLRVCGKSQQQGH